MSAWNIKVTLIVESIQTRTPHPIPSGKSVSAAPRPSPPQIAPLLPFLSPPFFFRISEHYPSVPLQSSNLPISWTKQYLTHGEVPKVGFFGYRQKANPMEEPTLDEGFDEAGFAPPSPESRPASCLAVAAIAFSFFSLIFRNTFSEKKRRKIGDLRFPSPRCLTYPGRRHGGGRLPKI